MYNGISVALFERTKANWILWGRPGTYDSYSARPVVCIPSNLLEYNSNTSSWDINLKK